VPGIYTPALPRDRRKAGSAWGRSCDRDRLQEARPGVWERPQHSAVARELPEAFLARKPSRAYWDQPRQLPGAPGSLRAFCWVREQGVENQDFQGPRIPLGLAFFLITPVTANDTSHPPTAGPSAPPPAYERLQNWQIPLRFCVTYP